ncbi:MAG: hypothetical protein U9N34_00735 [Candidatus Cloacimonadota bacterium]|nr:hypothetical protein [Candidatus Cloacimonadota bacterium]
MKLKFLVRLLLFLFLISCGENSIQEPISGDTLIQSFEIDNNTFSITTNTPTNYSIVYQNSQDIFYGFSAKAEQSTEHLFTLSGIANTNYSVQLHLEGADSYQDTIFQFIASDLSQPVLQIHIVDIEQGDGNLIITPDNSYIAVDGGFGTHEPSWGAPGGEDDGSWDGDGVPIMLNYVASLGISHFDYLIETHNDMDHWGGIRDIKYSDDITYETLLSPHQTNNFHNGDYLVGDDSSYFSIRIINIGLPAGVFDNDNNHSIVLRIVYGEAEFLLTGDAEESLEDFILEEGFDISSDFIKIGHHGSNTSSSSDFLASVLNQNCKIGTVSFGTDNPYGHPHSLSRFRDYYLFGTNFPSIDSLLENHHFENGTIKAITDGNIIIINPEN